MGTEGNMLARFGLDEGNGGLLVAIAEAVETKVGEMGGSYSEICCGDRRAHVEQCHKRQDRVEVDG